MLKSEFVCSTTVREGQKWTSPSALCCVCVCVLNVVSHMVPVKSYWFTFSPEFTTLDYTFVRATFTSQLVQLVHKHIRPNTHHFLPPRVLATKQKICPCTATCTCCRASWSDRTSSSTRPPRSSFALNRFARAPIARLRRRPHRSNRWRRCTPPMWSGSWTLPSERRCEWHCSSSKRIRWRPSSKVIRWRPQRVIFVVIVSC